MDRCPNWYLSRPDAFRDATVAAFRDYEAGVIRGWPDEWAGAIVDGVRFIQRQTGQSRIDMHRKRQREKDTQAKRQRASGGGF